MLCWPGMMGYHWRGSVILRCVGPSTVPLPRCSRDRRRSWNLKSPTGLTERSWVDSVRLWQCPAWIKSFRNAPGLDSSLRFCSNVASLAVLLALSLEPVDRRSSAAPQDRRRTREGEGVVPEATSRAIRLNGELRSRGKYGWQCRLRRLMANHGEKTGRDGSAGRAFFSLCLCMPCGRLSGPASIVFQPWRCGCGAVSSSKSGQWPRFSREATPDLRNGRGRSRSLSCSTQQAPGTCRGVLHARS
jgi:hypothetical protein